MSIETQPTKGKVNYCVVNGVDESRHLTNIKVYESMDKEYITAKLTFMDTNGWFIKMNLKAGDNINLSFDGNNSKVYEANLFILKFDGQRSNDNLRSMIYTVDLVGEEYYKDRGAMVQKSFKNIPGTAAIQAIHGEFFSTPLKILQQSIGPIGTINPHVIASRKPFAAIDDLKRRLMFGSVSTGAAMYFRDVEGHVLAPLETLLTSMSNQQTFIQKATWGAHWEDIFNTRNAIIWAASEYDDKRGGSRSSGQSISAAANQSKVTLDLKTLKQKFSQAKSFIGTGSLGGGNVPSFGSAIGGQNNLGGIANFILQDTSQIPESTQPSNKAGEENYYTAAVKNGPGVTVQVPIQTGLNCTVGKGVYLILQPPTGDITSAGAAFNDNDSTGMYLVWDLVHSLDLDDRIMPGTTVLRCVKGGFSSQ